MNASLSSEDWNALQEIFAAALALEPPSRAEYLQAACAGRPTMRQAVEDLLRAADQPTGVDHILQTAAVNTMQVLLPQSGERFGAYLLTSLIGHGGMGVVYRAIRADDEYKKEVAIKVASFGLLTDDLRQRFLSERQILATLDHPHIARLVDGGTNQNGVPYVVMELVEGRPLDTWCDEVALSQKERIALMIKVARAVEYAHRHLVVHRDLKPENILVSKDGEPKLLDFGIAKALDPAVVGTIGMMTVDVVRLMTPEYASPEQIRKQPVTTATDVYQLGILLYALLTGRKPFQITGGTSLAELERNICEVSPPRPQLNADLDRILLHALEKDPARRYASAGELSDDLERYLKGFPVTARRSSWGYQARKFALRNKLAVGAAVLIAILIAGFGISMALEARRVRRERDTAQNVADFLARVFSANDPAQARGQAITARQLLDNGAAAIEQEPDLAPEVRDRLLVTLASAYSAEGDYGRARELDLQSLQIRRSFYGSESVQTAEAMGTLVGVDLSLEDYAKAEIEANEWVQLANKVYASDSDDMATALATQATMQFVHSHPATADATERRVIAIHEKLHGKDSASVHRDLEGLGNDLFYEGKFSEEEQIYRRDLASLQKGDWQNSPDLLDVMNVESRLGQVLDREGRWQDATDLLTPLLAMQTKIMGEDNDHTAGTQMALGVALAELDHMQDGEALMHHAFATEVARFGLDTMDYAAFEGMLAHVYLDQGRFAAAEPLIEDKMRVCRKNLGDNSLALARTLTDMARVQISKRQFAAADTTLHNALGMETALNGDLSPYAAADHLAIGQLLLAEDRSADARDELQQAVAIYQRSGQPDIPGAVAAQKSLKALSSR